MDTKELRRAYATLGLDDRASLSDARTAYLTWVDLVAETPLPAESDDEPATAGTTDLLHHELDLAWHAIEEAHKAGVLFPRQARGCQACGAMPAVRVTTHFVGPGRLRRRLFTESSVLCRDCGLEAARAARRVGLRSGWLGPIANLRALTRNSTEVAFLSRLKPSTRPGRRPPAATEPQRAPGLVGNRAVGAFAGIAAVVLTVGVVFPTGGGNEAPANAPTTTQANTLGGTAKG
ncbi:MAG: hypothetical protein ACT4QF_14660 [Sporichthyaceae bacterium]